MPVTSCPHCGHTGQAPGSHLGKRGKCPKCGQSFIMEELALPAIIHRLPPAPVMIDVTPMIVRAEVDCPFCGEAILANARKCMHCGETLDVALRAVEESRREARRSSRATVPVVTSVNTTVIVEDAGRSCSHFLHFVITLLTCGLWFPVWVICWAISD